MVQVVGFAADGEMYCIECARTRFGVMPGDDRQVEARPGYYVWPVFDDEESDTPESCAECRAFIPSRLTEDGEEYVIEAFLEDLANQRQRPMMAGVEGSVAVALG